MVERELRLMGIIVGVLVLAAVVWALIGMKGQQHEPDYSTGKEAELNSIATSLHPDSLSIEKLFGLNQDQSSQTYQVDDAGLTMSIYTSLIALEGLPKDAVFHCPLDDGSSYELDFYEEQQDVLHVQADASGCRFIHPDEGSALRSDDAFWQLIGEAEQSYGQQQ